MKVILKPAGLMVVVASFGALAFIAIPKKKPELRATVSPVAGAPKVATPDIKLATSAPTRKVDWSKGKRILEPDITGKNWRQLVSQGNMTLGIVKAEVSGHPYARRVVVTEPGTDPWNLQIAHPLDVAFKKGQRVRLTFWARSATKNPVMAVVEQAQEPYTKIVTRTFALTPQWQQFSEEWQQVEDTEPGWAHIDFQLGHQRGELEITGVVLDAVNP